MGAICDRQLVNLEFDRLYPVLGEPRAGSLRDCDWFAEITHPVRSDDRLPEPLDGGGTAPIAAAVITAHTLPIATASFVSIARMPPCAIGELETMGRRRGQSAAVAFDGTFRSGPASFSVPLSDHGPCVGAVDWVA